MNKKLIGISGKIKSGKDFASTVCEYIDSRSNKPFDRWVNTDYINYQKFDHQGYEIKKYAGKLKDIVCLITGVTRFELENQDIKDKTIGSITGEPWIRYVVYVERMHEDSTNVERLYLDNIFSNEYVAQEYCDNYSEVNYDILQKEVHKQDLTFRMLMQYVGTEAFRETIHPDAWVKALFSGYNADSKWIITDVRFKNEADRVKEEGGYVIRINRPLKLRFPKLFSNYKKSGIHSGNFENYIKDNHNKLFRSLIHISETDLDFYKGFNLTIDNDTNDVETLINNLKPIIL